MRSRHVVFGQLRASRPCPAIEENNFAAVAHDRHYGRIGRVTTVTLRTDGGRGGDGTRYSTDRPNDDPPTRTSPVGQVEPYSRYVGKRTHAFLLGHVVPAPIGMLTGPIAGQTLRRRAGSGVIRHTGSLRGRLLALNRCDAGTAGSIPRGGASMRAPSDPSNAYHWCVASFTELGRIRSVPPCPSRPGLPFSDARYSRVVSVSTL